MPNYKKISLADNIPSSKKLGNTIMIPNHTYDFGGIMSHASKESLSK